MSYSWELGASILKQVFPVVCIFRPLPTDSFCIVIDFVFQKCHLANFFLLCVLISSPITDFLLGPCVSAGHQSWSGDNL